VTGDLYDTATCQWCGHVAGLHSGSSGCVASDDDGYGGDDECGCDEYASLVADWELADEESGSH
jgi:hypothetical protein